MEDAIIPGQLLDSQEYKSLTDAQKFFLINLYICFGDCESFTIDEDKPQDIRQGNADPSTIYRKIRAILDAGIVLSKSQFNKKKCRPERVYSFKYTAIY